MASGMFFLMYDINSNVLDTFQGKPNAISKAFDFTALFVAQVFAASWILSLLALFGVRKDLKNLRVKY